MRWKNEEEVPIWVKEVQVLEVAGEVGGRGAKGGSWVLVSERRAGEMLGRVLEQEVGLLAG